METTKAATRRHGTNYNASVAYPSARCSMRVREYAREVVAMIGLDVSEVGYPVLKATYLADAAGRTSGFYYAEWSGCNPFALQLESRWQPHGMEPKRNKANCQKPGMIASTTPERALYLLSFNLRTLQEGSLRPSSQDPTFSPRGADKQAILGRVVDNMLHGDAICCAHPKHNGTSLASRMLRGEVNIRTPPHGCAGGEAWSIRVCAVAWAREATPSREVAGEGDPRAPMMGA
ncbi:hypothetical protein GQ53DRAFT_764934 [Thozetella sp. PMI_491]|nr:hypothetical protein GQ53DRAFT_764934 [Thozetella sp. PMI_491]